MITTAQLSELVNLPERRIRSWVTAGWLCHDPVGHGRGYAWGSDDIRKAQILKKLDGLLAPALISQIAALWD